MFGAPNLSCIGTLKCFLEDSAAAGRQGCAKLTRCRVGRLAARTFWGLGGTAEPRFSTVIAFASAQPGEPHALASDAKAAAGAEKDQSEERGERPRGGGQDF